MNRPDFEAEFAGSLVLMTTREHIAGSERAFDVSWFIPALVRYRHILRDVLIASFALQIIALITPLFFQIVVDKVLVHKGLTTLEVLAIALFFVSVFDVLIGGVRTYLFSHTTSRVDAELGSKLFSHLTRLPLGYFQARRVGDSVARVRELDTIREFLTSSALTVVLDLFFAIVFLVVMYLYSPTLLLIVLASLPLYAGIVLFVAPLLRRKLDEKFARGAENQSFLVESVTGVETLKAMAVEPQMQAHWERQIAGYVKSSFQASMLANWGRQGIELVQKLSVVALLYFGARLVIDGSLTVGELVAFNMLASSATGPILRLAQLAQDFQQARIAVDRLGDILNTPPEPQTNPSSSRLPALQGRVQLDHVTFRYKPGGREILSDIDIEITAGEVLGVVGPSGSGKSHPRQARAAAAHAPSVGACSLMASMWRWSIRRGCGGSSASCSRRTSSSTAAFARTLRWPIPRCRWSGSSKPPSLRVHMNSSWSCPRPTTRASTSAAAIFQAGSASAWRSRGRWRSTRAS